MERPVEHERLTLHRHLVLLHGFEEGRLRARRCAVDLVGEQQPGEQRALAEREVAVALVVHERSGEVGRKEVGGELSPGEVEPQRLGERPCRERLAEAGEVFEQHVAAGEDGCQDQRERLAFADHGDLDLVEHLAGKSGHVVEFE